MRLGRGMVPRVRPWYESGEILIEGGRMPTFKYTVDDEPQTTTSHDLTANEILSNAGFDVTKYYLVQLIGDEQKSYKDAGATAIEMHEHMKFITVKLGSTPLSRWR